MNLTRRPERYAWSVIAAATAGATFAILGPATGANAAPAPSYQGPQTPQPGSRTAKATSAKTAASLGQGSPQAAFIAKVAPAAQQSQRATGVPASVTIAQAILESGWGSSSLASGASNYFGIKCWGGAGQYGSGCGSYRTQEYVNGSPVAATERFRSYRNAAASFTDFGTFLRTNSRYRAAFAYTRNPDQFIRAVHAAGYATSPTYTSSVIALMRQWNLYRFDR